MTRWRSSTRPNFYRLVFLCSRLFEKKLRPFRCGPVTKMVKTGGKSVDAIDPALRGNSTLSSTNVYSRLPFLLPTLMFVFSLSILSMVATLRHINPVLFELHTENNNPNRTSVFGTPRPLNTLLLQPREHVDWKGIDIGRTGVEGIESANESQWTGRGMNFHSFLWHPAGDCIGSFSSEPAEHSTNGFPYVIIRDAVVDSRIASRRQLRLMNTSRTGVANHRIILYLSVHLSARLTATNATAVITVGRRTLPVLANVDYVHRVDKFLIPYRTYQPGLLNQKGKEVSEWQIAISLYPNPPSSDISQDNFTAMLLSAAASPSKPATLNLSLPIIRYDEKRIPFRPWMRLACAMGWLYPTIYPPIPRLHALPKCLKGLEQANGAVVLSGSALYGDKNQDPQYFREIAHFAVRALYGPVMFSAVVMSIVVKETVSSIIEQCGDDTTCRKRHVLQNLRHLEWAQRVVDAELDDMRISRGRAPSILLVPACRLGSYDAAPGPESVTERGMPCGACHQQGQYHATFFTYALVGSYFKWAMLYDMDEVVMDDPRRDKWRVRQADASDFLDEADKRDVGYVTFPWLHFLGSVDTTRVLTREVLRKFAPRLRVRRHLPYASGDNVTVDTCLKITDINGKAGVRCDVGLGFTIHASVVRDEDEHSSVLAGRQVYQYVREVRTWHARLDEARGYCAYVYNLEGRNMSLEEMGEALGAE